MYAFDFYLFAPFVFFILHIFLSDVENVNLAKLLRKKKIFHILQSLLGLVFCFYLILSLLQLDPVCLVHLDKVKILTAQQWTHSYSFSGKKTYLFIEPLPKTQIEHCKRKKKT